MGLFIGLLHCFEQRPPLTRGLGFAKQKTGGEILSLRQNFVLSSPSSKGGIEKGLTDLVKPFGENIINKNFTLNYRIVQIYLLFQKNS